MPRYPRPRPRPDDVVAYRQNGAPMHVVYCRACAKPYAPYADGHAEDVGLADYPPDDRFTQRDLQKAANDSRAAVRCDSCGTMLACPGRTAAAWIFWSEYATAWALDLPGGYLAVYADIGAAVRTAEGAGWTVRVPVPDKRSYRP